MTKERRFRETIKNKSIIVGLTAAAVLFVIADRVGEMLTELADSNGSVNRAIHYIEKHRGKSMSVGEYLEDLKEVSGVNLYNTIYRLQQKGLVTKTNSKKERYVLTFAGRQLVDKIKLRVAYRTNWDKKWRLITFDVPEKKRRDRDWLRNILHIHEYNKLHKSVFLGKFPLPEEIYREIYKRKLAPFVHILTVGEIDADDRLL